MSTRAPSRAALTRHATWPVTWLMLMGTFLLFGVAPAAAHKLKVFATVEGGTISGYAFFMGGGRPEGAHVMFRDGSGRDIAATTTDNDGAFTFTPDRPGDVEVVVDAGDGHSAETRIAAARLAPLTAAQGAPGQEGARQGATAAANATPSSASTVPAAEGSASGALPPTAGCDPVAFARLVDVAVARQIRPLLEAQEATQDKLRFNDIAGGIGMIVGLAGVALWATSRRKARPAPPRA